MLHYCIMLFCFNLQFDVTMMPFVSHNIEHVMELLYDMNNLVMLRFLKNHGKIQLDTSHLLQLDTY